MASIGPGTWSTRTGWPFTLESSTIKITTLRNEIAVYFQFLVNMFFAVVRIEDDHYFFILLDMLFDLRNDIRRYRNPNICNAGMSGFCGLVSISTLTILPVPIKSHIEAR